MKEIMLIVLTALLAAMTGCRGPAAVQSTPAEEESSSSAQQTAEPEGSAEPSQVEETDEPEAPDTSEDQEEGEFTNLELEITEGTLYIRSGDSFSLTRQDGAAVDYEISDGTLYFDNRSSGKVVLTLPKDSYETLRLTVGNGHVYAEGELSLQNLKVDMKQGEATLEALTVAEDSLIEVEHGSAFLSGDLGQTVTANCREGHLSLEVPFGQEEYNYEIELSGGGNIRIGEESYHGKSTSKTVDHGGDRSAKLTCSRGDISMEFQKGN